MNAIWNVMPWYGWLCAGWFLVVIADWQWPECKAADCREGRTHGQGRTLLPARRGDL